MTKNEETIKRHCIEMIDYLRLQYDKAAAPYYETLFHLEKNSKLTTMELTPELYDQLISSINNEE